MQPNQYFIHADPTRVQQVQHYYSSLDTPTLDNVQSQLEAQRIKNHQMGAAYFQQKYGNSARYQEMVKNTGYQPPEQQPPTSYKPNLYSVSGNQEYQDFLRNVLKQKQKEIEQAVNNQTAKPKSKHNPWLQTKKQQIKPQQIKYVNDFQKFRQNKTKKQQKLVEAPKKKKKNYKRQLIIKVFRQIDQNSTGYIQKPKLVQYLKNNIKIIQVCDLNESTIATDVYSYQTENPEKIKLNQLLQFFDEDGNIQKLRQSINYSKLNTKQTLLSLNDFRLFQEIFKSLDLHNDLIIKRKAFIQALMVNPQVQKILHKPAIKQTKIDRDISLDRILQRIELQQQFAQQDQKKIKQYLYFNQFLKYFQTQHRWDQESRMLNSINLQKLTSYLNRKYTNNQILNDKQLMDILAIALKKTSKEGPYFLVSEFKRNIESLKQYKQIATIEARVQSDSGSAQTQIFMDIMNRIVSNHHQYISITQFLQYLGSKGYPHDIKPKSKYQEGFSSKHITPLNQQQKHVQIHNKQQIDGYDSDPQIYQSGVFTSHKKLDDNFRGTFVSIVENTDTFTKLRAKPHSKSQGKIVRDSQQEPVDVFKITVPEPFSFENRQLLNKKKKFKQDGQQNVMSKTGQSFRAKDIPKQVLQIGRYQKINEDNQKRRQNIKKMSMLASLAVEKPFGFLTREPKARKKNVEQRKQFVFKSKPVPWYCKASVYKQKTQQQDRLRKERIQKMAQQSLAKAKLPPRMQKHIKQQQVIKQQQQKIPRPKTQQTQFKAKAPPNFNKLHKQLQEKLQKNKQSKQPTVSSPFALTQTKIKQPVVSEQLVQKPKIDPVQHARKLNSVQPKIKAGSTLKYQNQVQKRRKDIQQRKKKQEQRNRVEKNLFQEDVKIKLLRKKQLQQLQKKADNRASSLRKQAKKQQQDFKQWKQQRINNAKAQPLLYQRPLKRDQQLQKMKKLAALYQIVSENTKGLKQNDKKDVINNLFNKEERNLIQDYEYLLKHKKV